MDHNQLLLLHATKAIRQWIWDKGEHLATRCTMQRKIAAKQGLGWCHWGQFQP